MKKIILTIAGSALVALSAVQFAAANEHHGRVYHHGYTEFRDSNAYAAPAYEAYRYSGGWSAPAGR
jgi:hypothetical protein